MANGLHEELGFSPEAAPVPLSVASQTYCHRKKDRIALTLKHLFLFKD